MMDSYNLYDLISVSNSNILQETAASTGQISTGLNAVFWLILGILLSIIVSLISRMALNWIRRPKLEISDPILRYEGDEKLIVAKVSNDGKSVAKNCVASIKVKGVNEDTVSITSPESYNTPYHRYPTNRTISGNICWGTPSPTETRTINRNDTGTVLICKEAGERKIVVPSTLGWKNPLFVLSTSDQPYEAMVQVTSENSKNCEKDLQINFM